ncbi:folate-sensitive fragile site protein Fra10Ac1-domain-containing protein [Favolaschia claudopus]|uniref:Folate-sensitive fragile site protein Fra10Ac1-domain-containing protein n=1 Tax=Favolaschia claudopus TaxID=2862362 RepID=A0AAW0C1Q0_9AGAR
MALYPYPSTSKAPIPRGKTEFEILKASHKSVHIDPISNLATKYYDSLFREYAVCDLKHYKSGNFALRWRTESEVLSGAGETTCGNTRCEHHDSGREQPQLTTLELPFSYSEHGDAKSALVKAVLCSKCLKKLMWKRRKEKEEQAVVGGSAVKEEDEEAVLDHELDGAEPRSSASRRSRVEGESRQHRKRSSRSRSPRRHHNDDERHRRRSPAR